MISFDAVNVQLPKIINNSVKLWLNQVILSYNAVVGDINYLFCNDDYIIQVNRQYLNHNYYTDIITFDYTFNNIITGDIVISIDTVKSNALNYNTSFQSELLRVVVHGVLHLCGFNDKTEEESLIMRQLEDDALKLYSTFE